MKDYKSKAVQLHSYEEKNQELKAKIICLEQNLRDKTAETDTIRKEVATLKESRTEKEVELEKENADLRLKLEERVQDNAEDLKTVLSGQENEIISLKAKLSEFETMNIERESIQNR